MPPRFTRFRFWCQSVLPLVYDDSLSYYEVLCKVIKYINDMVDAMNELPPEIDELKKEIAEIQEYLDNFDAEYIESLINKMIKNVFFGLTASGYFVAFIPDGWEDITFETTGYDVDVPVMPDFGHLVLSY